jgi:hypothetical protein
METMLRPRTALIAIGAIAVAALISVGAAFALNGDDEKAPPGDPGGQPTAPADDLVVVPADIESADVIVAESFPPQYFLRVVSIQGDGCREFNGYEVTRDGNKVMVDITNTEPKDLTVVLCLMIYKTTESNIALGSDFEAGETYEVIINGEKATEFVAQ